jgi:hypothetical protein
MKTPRKPLPLVEYDGQVYSLKSRKTVIPDFSAMDRFSALRWMCMNTRPRGYQKNKPKLAGLCQVLRVSSR